MTKVDAYKSSDYCGLDVGKFHFYFGYEETFCPKHKLDCGDDDCEKSEWCFTVRKGDKLILRIPESTLGKDLEVDEALVLGIGHYINTL